jgi:hypothetical protein
LLATAQPLIILVCGSSLGSYFSALVGVVGIARSFAQRVNSLLNYQTGKISFWAPPFEPVLPVGSRGPTKVAARRLDGIIFA